MTKRKSYIALFVSLLMLFGAAGPVRHVGAVSEDIHMVMLMNKNKAYINGEIKRLDAELDIVPFKQNDTIMVPVRAVAEALGAQVSYDPATAGTVVSTAEHSLSLAQGTNIMTADGIKVTMDEAAVVVNSRLSVPVLAFVEGLGYKAFWNADGVLVIGKKQLNPNNETAFISAQVAEITGDKYWQYTHAADYVPLEEVQKQLTFQTVTKEMVKEAIEKTGRLGKHPTLMVTEEDLARMKQYLADGDPFFKAVYDYTISFANNALTAELPQYKLDEANLRIADLHNFPTNPLPVLALCYRLTGEKQYLDHACAVLSAVSTFQDWGAPRHFLDAGVATTYVALAYDLLYDELTKPERAAIENAILENTIKPGLKGMEANEFWTTQGQNWNTICHTGIRLGAYVCYESNPDYFADIIAMTFNRETEYIRAFEPMGQSEEGQSYFDYGVSFMELGFEADFNILGTDFGLSDTNGLRNAGWFPLRSGGTTAGISLGDADVLTTVALPRLWFAYRYNDIELAKLIFEKIEREKTYDWRMLLFYDADLYDKAMNSGDVSMPQLDNYTPALDIIAFRNNWTTKGNFISLHAGKNNASHGHLDAGQVDIQANGVHWVMGSLGKDNYVYPGYFDQTKPDYNDPNSAPTKAGRNHFYRIRTEGKTAVVIKNGDEVDLRPEQDPNGVPVIETIVSKPKGAYSVVNLTDAYNRDVRSYRRGIMMSNERQVMTIQDEIETKSDAATVWWLMNTPADIRIAEDGRSAVLSVGPQEMWVELASPAEAVFKEIPATYLPGEEFPLSQNTPNKTKKLAIEMKNVSSTTITVHFVPLAVGDKEPAVKLPTTKAMDKWNIESGSLVVTEKPKLTDLKVDGVTVEGFQSDFYAYTVLSPMAMDSETEPVVEGTSQDIVTYSKDEGVVVVMVTDRDNPDNKTKYLVDIRKMGSPETAAKLPIVSAEASQTPEANHTADLLIDGDSKTADSRWSSEGAQTVDFDLGSEKQIEFIGLAIMKGHERKQIFSVQTSVDKENWQTVYEGNTSGETDNMEYLKLEASKGRYVRLNVSGNDVNQWNSILEVMFYGR